uniref:Ubiquitin-like protease family profile domain-containing protein n=1 Tax=Glossina austeni TaxID=7395 RepID=A0A1A9VTD0_GLOAU
MDRHFMTYARVDMCLPDIQRLAPGRWLNDRVVEAYTQWLLKERTAAGIREQGDLHYRLHRRVPHGGDRHKHPTLSGVPQYVKISTRCQHGSPRHTTTRSQHSSAGQLRGLWRVPPAQPGVIPKPKRRRLGPPHLAHSVVYDGRSPARAYSNSRNTFGAGW